MNRRQVGWVFAGPALLVIAVFFALPVASGLALSLTAVSYTHLTLPTIYSV